MFKNLFKKANELRIVAPLSGKVVAIEEVPDPVFNQKMMGEGAAIIPNEGKVLSPVDGKIVQIPDSKHAIGLEANDGTEILIHIGLETVALNGKGFTPKVATGDTVSTGQLLMEFDIEYIREYAKDCITPIVITNSINSDKQFIITKEKEGNAGKTVIITSTDS